MLVDNGGDLLNVDDAGALRCVDDEQRHGGAGRHVWRFCDELLGKLLTRAQAAQMVVHAADDRPVHADGRGFAAVERLRDLLAERQP